MKKTLIFLTAMTTSLLLFSQCKKYDDVPSNTPLIPATPSNEISSDRMLLVLSAPSVNDPNYYGYFQDIIDFQVGYVNAVMGHDNIVIVADEATIPYLRGRLPEDVLIQANLDDIWMRDFTTVRPSAPVQFKYTNASMSANAAQRVQGSFNDFASRFGLQFGTTHYYIDGGNFVDNYAGKAVVTERFMEDNFLTESEAINVFHEKLGTSQVAIIPADDEVLAHADGMVMWVDDNTLLMNDYTTIDPALHQAVHSKLTAAFPNTTIATVPVAFDNNTVGGIGSACGININSLLTYDYLYVPTFGSSHEAAALQIIRNHTNKTVIEVPAGGVCGLGGSVRCTTLQLAGDNAQKLIEAARQ